MPTLLLFLILFVTGVVTIISSMGSIVEEGTQKFTKRGKVMIFFIGILVFLPLIQNWLQQRAEGIKDDNAKLERRERDSTLQARYDSSLIVMKSKFDTSNIKYVSVVSETLGKYGYKLDSATKSLKKVFGDSAKVKTKEAVDPVLAVGDSRGLKGIDFKGSDDNYYHYEITIVSQDAGSSHFLLKCSAVILDSLTDGFIYLSKHSLIENEATLSIEGARTSYFRVEKKYKFNFFAVWIRGTYKNVDGTKTYFIDQVNFNNKAGNTSKIFFGPTALEVKQIVDQMEKR